MKLVSYAHDGAAAVGVETPDGIAPAGAPDLRALIEAGPERLAEARETAARHAARSEFVTEPQLVAPLRPGKLLFCGVNYAGHLEENPGAVLPEEPFFFSKLPSAVVGPGEPIVIPPATSQVDWEVELAVVIGRRTSRIRREAALDHVFGYTLVNDVSARDIQFKNAQITLGKNLDSFCPLGPCVALTDEIPDPSTLQIASYVNGEERQREHTSNMLFPVDRLLEFVSALITLEAGDIVTTGTPAGVGVFRQPPQFLRPGDDVTVEADRIGRLTNPVLARS